MKRVRFSFLLTVSLLWTLTSGNLAFAECSEVGKVNGSECHYDVCECASDVCYNGRCAECASDSDCQDGMHCSKNNCQ